MIVDAHVHYSQADLPNRPYDKEFVEKNPKHNTARDLVVDDVVTAAIDAGVDKVVQVTKTKMGYDNRYSFEGALQYPDRIVGVVGRFDPVAPDLENRLVAYAAQPCILGIRLSLLSRETKPWLSNGALNTFFSATQKHDIAVQLLAPNQAKQMRDVARRFPGVRFLVDHMALSNDPPHSIHDVFRHWSDVIALAREPNIWLKVSFFPEAARFSEPFPFPLARHYFLQLYENVGSGRLVWGSNFPPVTKACSYREALDFVRVHCDFLTHSDRDAILGRNFLCDFAVPREERKKSASLPTHK